MPETAVNKYYLVMAHQCDVRPAGQSGAMQRVTNAHPMNYPSHYEFGLGVAAMN